jgi:hypothetical protein
MTTPIIIVWTLIVMVSGKPSIEIHDLSTLEKCEALGVTFQKDNSQISTQCIGVKKYTEIKIYE